MTFAQIWEIETNNMDPYTDSWIQAQWDEFYR